MNGDGGYEHREIVHEQPGAKVLVLFIHGILGSPRQFLPYIDMVCDAGYSAAALLLPGHGGDGMLFARAKLAHWEAHVCRAALGFAERYERIVIVGHSMGGLLGLNQSLDPRSHIAGAFMISPPIQINLAPWSIRARAEMALSPRMRTVWRHYRDVSSVGSAPVLLYPMWIRQLAALKRLIEKTKRNMGAFTVPVCIVHSRRDEAVSLRSANSLAAGLVRARCERVQLRDSWHAYFTDADIARISAKLMGFLARVSQ